MVSSSHRTAREPTGAPGSLKVVTADGAAPCGICRQAIAEFAAADVSVHCYDAQGKHEIFTFGTLLPKSFESTEVRPRPDSSKR